MSRRIGVLIAAAAALVFSGCTTPSPSGYDEQEEALKVMNVTDHDCLEYWGDAANDLLPKLKVELALNGRGWACRLPGPSGSGIHSALRMLHTSLTTALDEGWGACVPQPLNLPPPTPAQLDVGGDALLVRNLLEADRAVPIHDPFGPAGWLKRPNPDNPALPKARELLAAVKEALDM